MYFPMRILLLFGIIGFSLLFFIKYKYSDIYFKTRASNGTNTLTNDQNNHLHDKINDHIPNRSNLGFIHAFIMSISVIIVSELGDKTFFIAAIMAMRHSRLTVYAGAMGALGAMTVLSALLGNIVTTVVPRIYTYYISSILFACFGIKMLKDGYAMSADEGTEEYEEAQHEIEQAEASENSELGNQETHVMEEVKSAERPALATIISIIRNHVSTILIQAFIMTFLAEWGDRSQITTIVLAASENLFGVIIGGTIGHGLCTGLAVVGGRFIAQRISPKTVTIVGGIVFLCFAFSAIFIRPDI